MIELRDILMAFISLFGVLSSGLIAFIAYSLNKQAERAQSERAISAAYSNLMDFRASHPIVMKLSRIWDESCFGAIYTQETERDNRWVEYYTYVELCINFCNLVILGRKSRLLDRKSYEGHYKLIVKLLLTEHHPIITTMIKSGKYISANIIEFRRELEAEGWDWGQMHKALSGE